MRTYIPLYGPKGIVVKIHQDHIYVGGSTHILHWLHHFWPGARRREIECGVELAGIARREGITDIRGHSVGGCIAQIASRMVSGTCMTWGTKRAPDGYENQGTHYRHHGDIVPLLPPWRPRVDTIPVGSWRPFWLAHEPREYKPWMS